MGPAVGEPIDVLVVGAGPTGLSLSSDLARRGVVTRTVDAKAGPEPYWKAGNLWPRTLELLSGLPRGFIAKIQDQSLKLTSVHLHAFGRHLADIPGDRYDSPFNAALVNGQNVIETALSTHLSEVGAGVEYGMRLIEARDRGNLVEAVCEAGDGTRHVITARYLVGCDGGRSIAREAAGLAFEPEAQAKAQILLADVMLSWARPTSPDRMWVFLYENGYAGIVPQSAGNHHIWFFERVENPQREDPTPQQIEQRLREVTGDPTVIVKEGLWFSHIAEPRTGVAASLRRGRILLAGDAGHVSLPVGGQGMNTGIQDSFNLGWKLAALVGGTADDGLLDTYEAERLPVRSELRDDQLAGMKRMLDAGPIQKLAIRFVAPWLARTGGATEFAGQRDAAMLDIAYPNSPLTEDRIGRSGVVAGDRAPDAVVSKAGGAKVMLFERIYGHGGWTLLAFDGGEDANLAAVALEQALASPAVPSLVGCSIHANPGQPTSDNVLFDADGLAHEAFGLRGRPALVLVRPDGHIALRAPLAETERLEAYWLKAGMSCRDSTAAGDSPNVGQDEA